MEEKKKTAEMSPLAVPLGLLAGSAFGLLSYFWVLNHQPAFGWTMFVITPFLSAYVSGWIGGTAAAYRNVIWLIVLTLGTVGALGLEGAVCILMAMPLVAVVMLLGAFLAVLLKTEAGGGDDSGEGPTKTKMMGVCFLLVAVPIVQYLEETLDLERDPHDVISTITLDASPQEVWDQVKSLDRLSVPRPMLMKMGLPTPTRCVLHGEAVGAKRICYFDQGKIEQEVTRWDPPSVMTLKITHVDLQGRTWLGFSRAEYRLRKVGRGTELTRSTSVKPTLHPVFYWKAIENFTVSIEHRFLFEELQTRF